MPIPGSIDGLHFKRSKEVEPLFKPSDFDDEEHPETRAAIDLLEAHQRLITPCIASVVWFEDFITRWLLGDPVEAASGLSRSQAKAIRKRLQDMHLRDAAALVDIEYVAADEMKAVAIALVDEIRRFEKHHTDPMPTVPGRDWYPLRCCIWRARRFGKLPLSWEQIARRLQ